MRPFHMNSSVQEIATTWLGAKVQQRVIDGFMNNMGMSSDTSRVDPTLQKMFTEMANSMPLRSLALFGPGISPGQLQLLLHVLNHKYLSALRQWWQLRNPAEDS